MRKFVLAGLLIALCTTVLMAQATTGSIYGTVATPDGLVITGVKVTLSSGMTAARTMLSSDRGGFRFGELPIGEYTITCEKDGYQKVVTEGVVVNMGVASRVEITMEPSAAEALITITGETAVVDLKKTGTSTHLTQDVLANIPSARDPWVILDQTAGIQTDRVNIGGAESGQQSNFTTHGSSRSQSSFNVDGVTITDQAALGASALYYDYDSFEEMQFTTSGADASVQIGGTNINFITKQGSDTFHGQGSIYYTSDSFQDKNVPFALEHIGYVGNQISSIKDYGFDAGGPVWKGKVWFWGAYRVQDIILLAVTGAEDATKLENINLKFTGQLGDRNRWTFFYTRGDKIKSGRGASEKRPPDTTWDQEGPTPIYKIEDTFMATDSLILSAKYAFVGGGFSLMPKGGLDTPVTYEYDTGVFGGSYSWLDCKRPQYQLQISGENYVEEAFGGSHEIKAGFEWRKTPVSSFSGYGGNRRLDYDGGVSRSVRFRAANAYTSVVMRNSFYLMDVFSRDRWTFNFGVRYDRQWGNNTACVSEGYSAAGAYLPDLEVPDAPSVFTWNDIVPRIGMTYDITGDGKFIARANFSMYANQLGSGTVTNDSKAGFREVRFYWDDINGDGDVQNNELGDLYYWSFNYENPLEDPGHYIDSNLSAPRSLEFLLGVEKELLPELSASVNYIYRRFTNFTWTPYDGLSSADYYNAGTIEDEGFTAQYWDTDVSRPKTDTHKNRPGYYRVYQGLELQMIKRLSDRWMANVSFNYHIFPQYYPTSDSYVNPTNVDRLHGRYYAPLTGGSGKSDIWIGSQWALKATGLYQLPWGINVSGFVQYRQGTPWPLMLRVYNNWGDSVTPYAIPFGDERLPAMFMMDGRVEKSLMISDFGRLDLILDVFNVFNLNTPIRIEHRVYSSNFLRTNEVLNPRVFRFGFRFRF